MFTVTLFDSGQEVASVTRKKLSDATAYFMGVCASSHGDPDARVVLRFGVGQLTVAHKAYKTDEMEFCQPWYDYAKSEQEAEMTVKHHQG